MKLGELFVDLGVNAGSAFGTLSGFAFKFNQLADLAKNVGNVLDNVFGTTPQYAHDIQLLTQATDISRKSIQGMSIAAKENGGSLDQMMAKIRKYDDEVFQMKLGKGGLAERLGLLGVSTADVLNARNGIDIVAAIMKTANRLTSSRDRASLLGSEGFTIQEANVWNEYLKNRAKYDNDKRQLTKEEINNLGTIWKIQQKLANDRRMALDKLRAQNAGKIVQWETKLNNVMEAFDRFVYGNDDFSTLVENVAKNFGNAYDYFKKTKDIADDFSKSQFWDLAKEFTKGFMEGLSELGEGIGRLFYVIAHPKDFHDYREMADFIMNGNGYNKTSSGGAIVSALSQNGKVDARLLGLRGIIDTNVNSVPFVAGIAVDRLKKLDSLADDFARKNVLTFGYTSMSGGHAVGSSHSKGLKADVQFYHKDGTRATGSEVMAFNEILRENGFIRNGGIGYEPQKNGYSHFDTFLGPLEDRVLGAKNSQPITVNNELNISTTDRDVADDVVRAFRGEVKNTGALLKEATYVGGVS